MVAGVEAQHAQSEVTKSEALLTLLTRRIDEIALYTQRPGRREPHRPQGEDSNATMSRGKPSTAATCITCDSRDGTDAAASHRRY